MKSTTQIGLILILILILMQACSEDDPTAPATVVAPEFVLAWGSSGSGDGQFDDPWGVACDASGNVFVVDWELDRAQKFDSDGNYLGQFGTTGSGDGQFDAPWNIACDAASNVYVTDYENNRVQKFDNSGTYLGQFGTYGTGDGQFDGPVGVGV